VLLRYGFGIGSIMLLARVNTGIISLGEGLEIDAIPTIA